MGKITTGLIDIFSSGRRARTTGSPPRDRSFRDRTERTVRRRMRGITDIKVRPGVQFSKDGITWSDAPKAIDLDSNPNEYATMYWFSVNVTHGWDRNGVGIG